MLIKTTTDACYDDGYYTISGFNGKEYFRGDSYKYEAKDNYLLLLNNKSLVQLDYSGKELKKSKDYDN